MSVVIGIPQTGRDLFRRYMKSQYVQSIERSGGVVRWIELDDLDRALEQMLECDGMVLPGGGDVAPHYYGQEPSPKCGKPNKVRDEAEWRLLEAFLPANKPILGICRGVQFLNVYLGGTLHQDIQDAQKVPHQSFSTRKKGCHRVRLLPESRLAELFGQEWITVNSMHHQVVDAMAPGLKTAAVSEDGFIEAVELPNHPFCVGVQWHPEHMSRYDLTQQRLFDVYVAACEEKKNR